MFQHVSLPRSLIHFLIENVVVEGAGHGKIAYAEESAHFNPYSNLGGKVIEYLTDSDTVRFGYSLDQGFCNLSGIRSFNTAWEEGIRFEFVFTLPAAVLTKGEGALGRWSIPYHVL